MWNISGKVQKTLGTVPASRKGNGSWARQAHSTLPLHSLPEFCTVCVSANSPGRTHLKAVLVEQSG